MVAATLEDPGAFFEEVSRTLARQLGVAVCFVTELIPHSRALCARTLAFWNRDHYLENFEYDLEGTPCAEVVQVGAVCHGHRLQDLFPEDLDLVELSVVSYAAVPMIDPEGEVIGHLAVLDENPLDAERFNLTMFRMVAQVVLAEHARRKAATRLEQRERLLRQVLDLTPHMVFAKDGEGRFLLANQALADRLGVGVEGILGRRDHDLVDQERADAFRSDDLRVLAAGRRIDRIEEGQFSRDGERHIYSTSKIPFDVAGSGTPAVVGVAVDITAQVLAEQRLRSLVEATAPATGREFFSILVAQLADLLAVDRVTVGEIAGEGRICGLAHWAHGAAAEPLDYDLTASPCAEVVATGAQFHLARGAQERFDEGSCFADFGSEHYLGTPLLGIDGEVIGILAVLDESPKSVGAQDRGLLELFAARAAAELRRQRAENSQRELQAQVLHVQKLESLGVLAGGIAHDFNNLLATILGNVGLALLQAPPDDTELRRYLEEIELAAERSGELTRQMLNYSGKGRTVVEALDLPTVIQEMGELLRSSVSKKAL
ncbi:MAG: GAF domain-containing protein, partial [Acidobacteriota bacterium]